MELLNQSVIKYIGDVAKKNNVKIAVRSVLLRGLLTSSMTDIPKNLIPLKKNILMVKEVAKKYNMSIEQLSILVAMSNKSINHVIIGVSSDEHLDVILKLYGMDESIIDENDIVSLNCPSEMTDPRMWEIL